MITNQLRLMENSHWSFTPGGSEPVSIWLHPLPYMWLYLKCVNLVISPSVPQHLLHAVAAQRCAAPRQTKHWREATFRLRVLSPLIWGHIFGSIDAHGDLAGPYIFSTILLCIICKTIDIFHSFITVWHRFMSTSSQNGWTDRTFHYFARILLGLSHVPSLYGAILGKE